MRRLRSAQSCRNSSATCSNVLRADREMYVPRESFSFDCRSKAAASLRVPLIVCHSCLAVVGL